MGDPSLVGFVLWVVSMVMAVVGLDILIGERCLNLSSSQTIWFLIGAVLFAFGIALNLAV